MIRTDTRASRGASATRPLLYLTAGLLAGLTIAALAAPWLWPATPAAGAGGTAAPEAAMGGGAPPPAPVDIVEAVEIVAAEPLQLLATAAPLRESLVASEVDGLVVALEVDEGSSVRAGAPLARLRTADVEQQLVASRASSQETAARLERAEADYRRFESLRERNVISEAELESARTDRDALARAAERLAAETARLEDQLERAEIRAPFAGRLTSVEVEVGEWVGRGDPIGVLVDLSEIEIRVQVAEQYIAAVEPGFPVTVRMDAFPEQDFEGRVTAIVPAAVPEARTFPVLIRVPNPGGRIKPGMAARVLAQLGDPEPTVLVAKDALVRRGAEVFVMRVMPGADGPDSDIGVIEQVSIVLGPARGQWQVVEGGIRPGDRIVVRGNERIFPGQPVRISGVRELPLPSADPDRPIATDPRNGGGA